MRPCTTLAILLLPGCAGVVPRRGDPACRSRTRQPAERQFHVESGGEVEIAAVGLRQKFTGSDAVRAWLMSGGAAPSRCGRRSPMPASRSAPPLSVRRSVDRVQLEPGDYVLYLAAGRGARDGKAFRRGARR